MTNSTFKFTGEHIENLLAMILDKDSEKIIIKLVKEPEADGEVKEVDNATLIKKIMSSEFHGSIGLKFLL